MKNSIYILGNNDRRKNDRRKNQFFLLNRYKFNGKRAAVRRKKDRLKPYEIDNYGYKIFIVIVLIATLSIFDALFTLHLIAHGANEINPVMAYFLDLGVMNFLLAKYLLTCFPLICLLLCSNLFLFWTKIRIKRLYILFTILFLCAIFWEIYLIIFKL